ncbi:MULTISPECIES: glycine zipper 2TM domain-containing protein [unclassified Sphingopyxis]|jgi:hypothetical protein|uniref:glycine zipper 2TM domain-containing protein n=1 Tax=unclassified Sphingopyxis TaxID=2614943 RepID=UPI0024AD790A|nr:MULTISPECIES: glycine zipper 2TM domain-containing protein [unclassified Sphingopyxis]
MRILTKGLMGVFVAASVVGTAPAYAGLSSAVPAQRYSKADEGANFYRKKDRRYYASRDQRINGDTRIWRGSDGRYRCKKDNGTTGLLIGGAVGGLAGHEIAGNGDKLLGTVLGAAGGALLGREIDRDKYRCR